MDFPHHGGVFTTKHHHYQLTCYLAASSNAAEIDQTHTSTCRLGGPMLTRKEKPELFSAFFKLHHLANCMYHRLEENETKRSSLLPFEGSQIWIHQRPLTAVVVVAVVHINGHNSKSNYFCSWHSRTLGELDETRRMSLLPASESIIFGVHWGATG